MSIPVDIDRLRAEVERFGSGPYLLTVSDDGRPHAVSVSVGWDQDALRAGTGSSTAAFADHRRAVTMLWPPCDSDGYSLIVDGQATVSSDDDRHFVTLKPTRAVLHRSRPSPDGLGSAGSDCAAV